MKELFVPTSPWDREKVYNLMVAFVKKVKQHGRFISREVDKSPVLAVARSWGDEEQIWEYNGKKYLLVYRDNCGVRVLSQVFRL